MDSACFNRICFSHHDSLRVSDVFADAGFAKFEQFDSFGGYVEDNRRSATFRYCHANGCKINLFNGELTIIFGIREDPLDPTQLFEEIGIVMTPEAAKLLADTLHQTLEQKENEPDYSEMENSISLAIDAKLNSDTPGS